MRRFILADHRRCDSRAALVPVGPLPRMLHHAVLQLGFFSRRAHHRAVERALGHKLGQAHSFSDN